ncbi:predicted protein [Nematostella vectensis]|uniref:Nucleoporin Nup43 n=1 Tax=Nematostella vectensis TaxID=45351 RepID=A7SRW2_NEMVE|nr:nucleoporin Nup43 [Nematostella vectensis]EDO33534.1 predicted protein [Nematostella vectensis]|eukprot:XP_001625634.1 predicted protein [Nematostella vectensis]
MAAGGEIVAKYVGHKISKARWASARQGSLEPSDTFTTGGWDDHRNRLSVWQIEDIPAEPGAVTGTTPNEPILVADTEHIGDVTDIQYVGPESVVVASSSGNVSLYQYNTKRKVIYIEQVWERMHFHLDQSCPCTSVATSQTSSDIITAGEDGRLNVLKTGNQNPIRFYDSADSTSINDITFTTTSEVVGVTFSGQVKMWDLRNRNNKPSRTMLLSGDRVPLLCVDKHPTQPHLLAAGGQDGVLSIWDMRQEQYPVTLLEGHSAEVWEVKFHPQKADHLFTCSEDGSVWQWDGTSMSAPSGHSTLHGITSNTLNLTSAADTSVSPWLSVDATKHRMETYSLLADNRLSINCLDIESRHLLCGSDCEAIFVIYDMVIR